MSATRRALLAGWLTQQAAAATTGQDDTTIPLPSELTLLVNRTTFGARQEEYALAQTLGYSGWLERQLNHTALDDSAIEGIIAQNLLTVGMTNVQILDLARTSGNNNQAVDELRAANFLRQLYSPRQLFETMVEFWTDHFNVQHIDGPVRYYKTVEDRELIRRHALGNFGDLLRGDARSPAMLYYLDNFTNVASGPNENYARELLELHTLGATGGYSETDVNEVARAFTGWTFNGGRNGVDVAFVFNAGAHDVGAKTVLGNALPAGRGIEDGNQVLDILLAHPSTGKYLATKLAQRFVSDSPPASLVTAIANTYASSGGDIKSMLRTLFNSAEFKASADQKFKRPAEFVMSSLRTLGATFSGNYLRVIGQQLGTFGHIPYLWPTPDGYPDERDYWTSTSSVIDRWNFGFGLADGAYGTTIRVDINALIGTARTPEQIVDTLAARLLRRPLADNDRASLIGFAANRGMSHRPLSTSALTARTRELVGLMLGSAYFQYR
jgi:uncharacterized protein (DUF1800 family)